MYDYIITKPPLEKALMHYGVKGMKWGKNSKLVSSGEEAYKIISTWSDKEYQDRLRRVKLVGGKGKSSSSSKSSGGSGKSSSSASKASKSESTDKTTKVDDNKKEVETPTSKITVDPNVTKRLQEKLDRLNTSKLDIIKEKAIEMDKKKNKRKQKLN